MRRLLQFFCWLVLSIANLALSPLVWLAEKLEWLMLPDEERWEREEKKEWERLCRDNARTERKDEER